PSDSAAHFGLAFATASPHGLTLPLSTNSQAHSSKGTPSPTTGRLRRLVSARFQDLFHSPPGVLFTFPSRYLSAIGHQGIFRLGGWSRQIHTRFLEPRATWETPMKSTPFRLRGSHPLRRAIQDPSTMTWIDHSTPRCQSREKRSHNPEPATPDSYHTSPVWPHPRSLATTNGIPLGFSSCGY